VVRCAADSAARSVRNRVTRTPSSLRHDSDAGSATSGEAESMRCPGPLGPASTCTANVDGRRQGPGMPRSKALSAEAKANAVLRSVRP
jgi:hypothetical protein